MMTPEFAEEVAGRMEECEGDTDLTTAPVFGVVYHGAAYEPMAIDVMAGQHRDVRVAAEATVEDGGFTFYTLVPFGVLDTPRPKSSLIMETALRVAG